MNQVSHEVQTPEGAVFVNGFYDSSFESVFVGTDKLTILRLRSGSTLPLSASNCARNGASGP